MPLILYNSLTKQEEEFTSFKKGEVTMYTCGPTVYGRPHIGNYSSFLMADLLRRWLEVSDYKVTHVKNITDVGHLVADADEGEDKIEKQAKEEHGSVSHESVLAIARKYEEEYLQDEKLLHMLEPAHRPRATEYIDQMKSMIESMLQSGHAYKTSDGIYFDVQKFPTYGKLSGNTLENTEAGARVQVNDDKHHPADFALWKFCVGSNEHHALRWTSPSFVTTSEGKPGENNPEGFPGWHIECSAMSRALLGDQIDIHTGGEDNIFPHHECEIAQSESVTQKEPFVRYWLHRRRIDIGDQKMSKSLGNVLTISNIQAKGFDPMDLRYYLLSVHYRTNLKFSEKGLDDAKKARRKIVEWMSEFEFRVPSSEFQVIKLGKNSSITGFLTSFSSAMNADLNTPAALATIFDCMTWSRTHEMNTDDLEALGNFIAVVRHTFGCFEKEDALELPEEVATLIHERKQARDQKDYNESDRLREAILALGYLVRDDENGQKVQKL